MAGSASVHALRRGNITNFQILRAGSDYRFGKGAKADKNRDQKNNRSRDYIYKVSIQIVHENRVYTKSISFASFLSISGDW
jgi:hypothetical protein